MATFPCKAPRLTPPPYLAAGAVVFLELGSDRWKHTQGRLVQDSPQVKRVLGGINTCHERAIQRFGRGRPWVADAMSWRAASQRTSAVLAERLANTIGCPLRWSPQLPDQRDASPTDDTRFEGGPAESEVME